MSYLFWFFGCVLQMSDLERFFDTMEADNILYTRPYQLPANVAFEIAEWQMPPSKYKSEEKTNLCLLNVDQYHDSDSN